MINTGLNSALNENKNFYQNVSDKNNNAAPLNKINKTGFYTPSNNDTFYYNDPKKEKRKKIFKYSTLITTAIVGVAALFKVGQSKHISEILKNLTSGIQQKSEQQSKAIANIMSNTINIKDDLWDKFAKKLKKCHIGIVDRIGNWITNVYKAGISNSLGKKYDKMREKLVTLGYSDIDDFKTWFDKTNADMFESLHKEGEKVTDNLFNKDIFKRVTSSNIADGKLKDVYSKQTIRAPEGASEELNKTLKEFNSLKSTMLAKMRDINCGSAPTDLLTIIMSTLGLGVATATADNKEERKSIVVNLGIPLIATLASTTYGTIKCFSGAKSLIFGLALGQVAKIGAKTIDNTLKKKDNQTI